MVTETALKPVGKSSPYLRRLVATGEDYLLSPYSPASWWHPIGRRKMVNRLVSRGFPQLFGWLFVTLTIDPSECGINEGADYTHSQLKAAQEAAFLKGSDRLRRAVHALREAGAPIKRYFSKFELTQAEWPHWHVGLDCREFIDAEAVSDAWGLGFTKVQRVKKGRDFRYLFKYVVKDGGEIPEWVLDYPKRIRVFQTSVGFFDEPSEVKASASDFETETRTPTLRQKFTTWNRRGVVRAREAGYRQMHVLLRRSYPEIFIASVAAGARPSDAYLLPLTKKQVRKLQPWIPKSRLPKLTPPSRSNSTWERFQTVATSSGGVLLLPSNVHTARMVKTAVWSSPLTSRTAPCLKTASFANPLTSEPSLTATNPF